MEKLDHIFDEVDRLLLDIIQTDFPLCSRPYCEIGKRLGITEEEAFSRVTAMRKSGVIRRVGANYDAYKLGWVTTLCAANVPDDLLEEFVSLVNEQPGVTHNYVRSNKLNIWFTLTSPSKGAEAATLELITRKTGVRIINLPADHLFKVRVDFKMNKNS